MFTLPGWHLFGSKYRYPLNSVEIIYKKAVQKDSKKIFPLCKQKKKKKTTWLSIYNYCGETYNCQCGYKFCLSAKKIHSFILLHHDFNYVVCPWQEAVNICQAINNAVCCLCPPYSNKMKCLNWNEIDSMEYYLKMTTL